MLMPAFHYFPNEASIIGRILAGFGDLEVTLAVCAGTALDMQDTVLRTIFRIGSTAARIDAADALAREAYATVNLEREFSETITTIKACYGIRNQYAHCHWGSHIAAGLFFTNLEVAAEREKGFEHQWKHIDLALLQAHESYFIFAMECLQFLDSQFPFRKRKRRVPPPFAWPPKQSPPPRHNRAL